MLPNCTTESLSTQCVASCTSNFTFTCQATETLHLCTQKADCASDTMNSECCAVGAHHVCVSAALAGNLMCL
jgi:hypothetical protein